MFIVSDLLFGWLFGFYGDFCGCRWLLLLFCYWCCVYFSLCLFTFGFWLRGLFVVSVDSVLNALLVNAVGCLLIVGLVDFVCFVDCGFERFLWYLLFRFLLTGCFMMLNLRVYD